MSLRIGCDLDGVLADMESELIRQAKALFGDIAPRIPEPASRQGPADLAVAPKPLQTPTPRLAQIEMTDRQQRRLWRHVESIDGFWETLREIEPGMVARLATVANERRWELMFLTKRPESVGATAQVQTQRWLQAHGFTLPSVFVVQGSRGRVADAFNLDFVIDDRPENCLDVVLDSTTRALLVWRGDESLFGGRQTARCAGGHVDGRMPGDARADKRTGSPTARSDRLGQEATRDESGRLTAPRDLLTWYGMHLGQSYTAISQISQRVQSHFFEIINQRPGQRITESCAQLVVRRMPKVRRKPSDVVEVDRDEIVGGVGHPFFVAGAVDDTSSDAHMTNRRNLAHGTFERGDQPFSLRIGQVWSRLQQHDVSKHHRFFGLRRSEE